MMYRVHYCADTTTCTNTMQTFIELNTACIMLTAMPRMYVRTCTVCVNEGLDTDALHYKKLFSIILFYDDTTLLPLKIVAC